MSTAGEPVQVLLATRNAGKLRELTALLESLGLHGETLDAVGLPEHPDEDGLEVYETFVENARAKARYFHARSGGRLVLAEDSGLCVSALQDAPGVRSKRWGATGGLSGGSLEAANVARLLAALHGVADRTARFECAACLAGPLGEYVATGSTAGRILTSSCGEGGFGYDPVFHSTELDACFGVVDAAAKASVSHRSRAVSGVCAALIQTDLWGTS